MFGWFRSKPVEERSASVDVGQLYSAFFAFGGASSYSWQISPAILASGLMSPDGPAVLLNEARRLARTSPLLVAYSRCMVGGLLTGEAERPEFDESVPANVAQAAADLWTRLHPVEDERDALRRVMVDGEFLILDDGQIVPPDGFEPVCAGPEWMPEVTGYRIGRSASVRRTGFRYIGDRPAGMSRALPWIATALPTAAALLNIRTAAGHGLGAMAKVAAVIANATPDRVTGTSGHRSGVVDTAGNPDEARQSITSLGVGSVPYMRPGEAVARPTYGPDAAAREYEGQLEADCAAALNLPLHELRSDYSSGSFSNLRMAWQDADREYGRRRLWWHRSYRLPIWRDALSDAFADGRLPRMTRATMAALKNPVWPGPRREPPQPEKQASALALLVDKGILDPAAAAAQLEN